MTRSWYRYPASRVRMARRYLRLSLGGICDGVLVFVIRAIARRAFPPLRGVKNQGNSQPYYTETETKE